MNLIVISKKILQRDFKVNFPVIVLVFFLSFLNNSFSVLTTDFENTVTLAEKSYSYSVDSDTDEINTELSFEYHPEVDKIMLKIIKILNPLMIIPLCFIIFFILLKKYIVEEPYYLFMELIGFSYYQIVIIVLLNNISILLFSSLLGFFVSIAANMIILSLASKYFLCFDSYNITAFISVETFLAFCVFVIFIISIFGVRKNVSSYLSRRI